MGNQVINIPIRCIAWVFQTGALEDFRILCQMKARCGRFIEGGFPQSAIDRMVKRGWLVPSGGKYYQKKWEAMFPIEGRYTHGKIFSDSLDNADLFKASLFVVAFLYLMSPQSNRRKRAPKGGRQVDGKRHNGGLSHGICMGFFGMSKGWCSKMRKFCKAMKVAKWTRRFLPVTKDGAGVITRADVEDLADGQFGRFRMIKGVLHEEVAAEFELMASAKSCIPYRYRETVSKIHA